MVSQLRFKADELVLARAPKVYSRWMVASRRDETVNGKQRLAEYAIACGGLAGFGGFFSRDFREDDYQLGRRNAQKFLRDTFALHENNPIFADWTAEQKQALGVTREKGRFLPIIALLGDCTLEVHEPTWPAGTMTSER